MNEEIEEIFNTPDSSYDTGAFYGILDEARHKYDDKQADKEQSIAYDMIIKERNKFYNHFLLLFLDILGIFK